MAQLRPCVVRLQHLETQGLAADPPVAVPRGDVVAKRLDYVVKYRERDVARLQRRLQ